MNIWIAFGLDLGFKFYSLHFKVTIVFLHDVYINTFSVSFLGPGFLLAGVGEAW